MTGPALENIFGKWEETAWPYVFDGSLHLTNIAGGTPSDPKVIKGHIGSKITASDDLIRDAVAEIMVERGLAGEDIDKAEAIEIAALQHLNGFKRDPERGGELYIEGRHLKACIKEAVSCAAAAGKIDGYTKGGKNWGLTGKGLLGFVPEHVFVVEDKLHLGVKEPTDVNQRFVVTRNGTGIQYEEFCEGVDIDFTLKTDYVWPDTFWPMVWLTAGQEGLGASRSLGWGRFIVTKWDQRAASSPPRSRRK